ncbi:MAG: hypothetical protein WD226_12810 [Planctomycetota bacterium]
MNLAAHLFFFLVLAFAIVLMSAFYAEADDNAAWKSVPKRYAVFVLSCAGITVVMLTSQWLFAGVG